MLSVGRAVVDENTITFQAAVYKVQTLATDNGVRVTLDLPETAIMQMAMLAECQRAGVALGVVCTPVDDKVIPEVEHDWSYDLEKQ